MREGTIREIERDREIGTTLIGLATFYRPADYHGTYILHMYIIQYTLRGRYLYRYMKKRKTSKIAML